LMMYSVDYPKPKSIPFDKYIDTSQAAKKEFLHQCSRRRDELMELVSRKKDKPGAKEVIKAAEAYFPLLMGLIQILQMPTTRVLKPLPFTWTSPVSHKDPKSFCTLTDYNYELVMIMHLLADAHMNRADELIARATEQEYDEPAKEALEELRIAAGMFEYVSKVMIFNWRGAPAFEPFECNAVLSNALRNLCLSMGQAIVVKKGLLHGTSMGVLSKISAAGFKKAEDAFKSVTNMREEKLVSEDLKDFLHAHAVVHKSNALMKLGEAAYAEEAYGMAIAYLKMAFTTSEKVKVPKDKDSSLYPYGEDIKTMQSIVKHKKDSYIAQNDNIFGKAEVDEKTVDVPDGTLMVKPMEFALPAASFKILQ